MSTEQRGLVAHPAGEQPEVAGQSAIADTYAGRVHVEWDAAAPVTPLGQLPFFIDYLKQAALFDRWVADCPLQFSSPNRRAHAICSAPCCCRCWRVIGATPMLPRCAAIQ